MEAIILSMNRKERHDPNIIDSSRRRRIARGCGCDPQEVSGLVKQFDMMRGQMKAMAGMSMMGRIKSLAGLSQAVLSGQGFGKKLKGSTVKVRKLSSKDKRRMRKKKRRR